MKVNIVCNDHGWIYDKFISEFMKHSEHEIVRNSKEECDVTHYVPYYEVPKAKHTPHPCTAWFSHRELKDPLKSKFIQAGQTVDVAISQSRKYKYALMVHGVRNAVQIMPGVDLDRFVLRDNPPQRDKLVLGYVGRQYSSSNRKNPKLLDAISKLDYVDLRITGGNLKAEDVPKFYADLDFVVSPATVEGGPMCVTEALAMGVPVICFADVGVADEFDLGVIKVYNKDDSAFLLQLKRAWHGKMHLNWHNERVKRDTRAQVENFTWENFVKQHDEIWKNL